VKIVLLTAIRFLAVTVLYFVSFVVVSGALLANAADQSTTADASATLSALLLISFINAAIWTYVIRRSRWTGWKLIVTVFLVFYGSGTVMPQIETAYFITSLQHGMLPRLFLAGIIIAAVFAPLAVLILGKARAQANENSLDTRLPISTGSWVARLSLIVAVYLVIYFTFGYFIAWKSAAVRAFYKGTDPGNIFTHLANVLRAEPLLFVLQAVRALLWAALAVPVIKLMRGDWWESGLAVALLFAVMTALLLLPNPLMPAEVRMAHLLETATSNFLFGWLVVLILRGTDRARLKLATQTSSVYTNHRLLPKRFWR
jgi:hypothetical protein